jgi:hypothetical protein
MRIAITSTHRVATDGTAWALQERRGQRWHTRRWYPSLSRLFDDLPETVLIRSNVKTIAEALADLRRLGKEMERRVIRLQRTA